MRLIDQVVEVFQQQPGAQYVDDIAKAILQRHPDAGASVDALSAKVSAVLSADVKKRKGDQGARAAQGLVAVHGQGW